MKIALIEPGAPGYHVFKKFVLPRLGLPIIGAILRKLGHEVKIYCEDLTKIDWNFVLQSDLIGISTITCTAERAYEIIRKIKKENAELPVIIGGPHVTFLSDEPLNTENGPADIVARKEGERTIVEIIEWMENKRNINDIKGISYKVANKVINNPDREQDVHVFDHIPFPALELIEGYKKMKAIPIQATRGCQYRCEFCSVTPMFGRNLRCAKVEAVADELEILTKLMPKKPVFFYDDNFVSNPKWTKELLRLIAARDLRFRWSAQTTVKAVRDPELMQLFRKTGCNQVFIGLESINPKTLKAWKKSQTVEEIEKAIKVFHQYKIAVHGMFVLGGDNDSLETIRDTVRFAIKMKVDTVMFSILTPLPGSIVYQKLENGNRLLSKSWRYYDSHHAVFEPKLITAWQLQKAVMLGAMPRFYSWGRVIKRSILGLLPPYNSKNRRLRKFILTIYGNITVRRFRKQKGERRFMQWLRQLPARLRREKSREIN